MASQQTQADDRAGAAPELDSIDLVVGSPISSGPQRVYDQQGNPSGLYVGANFVGAGAPAGILNKVVLQAQGTVGSIPLFAVHNAATNTGEHPEASIHFSNASDRGKVWHVGVGGGLAGPMNLFFWNSERHIVVQVDPAGNMNVAGTLKAGAIALEGQTTTLRNVPPVQSAPQGATLATLAVDTATGKLYAV